MHDHHGRSQWQHEYDLPLPLQKTQRIVREQSNRPQKLLNPQKSNRLEVSLQKFLNNSNAALVRIISQIDSLLHAIIAKQIEREKQR